MPDFNAASPSKTVTNPKTIDPLFVLDTVYPRHLHKYKAPEKGETYTSGEYCIVHNADEEAAALAEGWSLRPVLVDPDAPPAEKHAKPHKAAK